MRLCDALMRVNLNYCFVLSYLTSGPAHTPPTAGGVLRRRARAVPERAAGGAVARAAQAAQGGGAVRGGGGTRLATNKWRIATLGFGTGATENGL